MSDPYRDALDDIAFDAEVSVRR